MKEQRLVLLNTSILTTYGSFTFNPLSLHDVRSLVREFQRTGKTIESAIGHQATAELLSSLLDLPVHTNRIEFTQTANDLGLVFKLNQRPPEGKVLNREEIEEIGYEFGLLTRLA